LFRYTTEDGTKPKGVPIALESSTIKKSNDDGGMSFLVIQLDKTYTFRCSSLTECKAWMIAISERKSQAIREKLGHAPVTNSVQKANKAGLYLLQEKLKQRQATSSSYSHQVTINPLAL
jgi:hypothetical protein